MLKNVNDGEAVKILHIEDVPHLIGIATGNAAVSECIRDLEQVVLKFGATLQYGN